jgi:endonuclease/exonuclease/phosphatase (EEP) superfamily protein YafD
MKETLCQYLLLSQRFVRQEAWAIGSSVATPPPEISAAAAVRLLTWNVAKNTQKPYWQRDFTNLVQQHQPNLIFLQEAQLCATRQDFPSLGNMGWHFAPNFLDTARHTYSGVLTAANLSCIRSEAILTQHSEPIVNTPKVSLVAEYALDRYQSLLTVNAHLINFVDLGRFQAQLDELAERMQHHRGAMIFAGDFNTWNQSRWEQLVSMTKGLGLNPVSFPWFESLKIKRFLLSPPLDYVFYRGFQHQPLSAKVASKIASSDHKPLLVELASW